MDAHRGHAKYACDVCRSRKVSCTRELPECARCKSQGGILCSYSRSGVLRRNRKRRTTTSGHTAAEESRSHQRRSSSPLTQGTVLDRLERLVGREHASLRDIAHLISEYHSMWQNASAFDSLVKGGQQGYHEFEEEEKRSWANGLVSRLHRERIIEIDNVPQKVLDALVTSQPAQTCERAWWVMFYSIASRNCTMSELLADDLKASRLENNLWMSINDIGFLLQPSILNVQAIITMVVSAERCMLPQACWSLISKASTMLLGLGVGNIVPIDSAEKRQRDALFWRLNSMDKALALILCRLPIFQRELTKSMPLPSIEDLMSISSRFPTKGLPILFEAHYEQQMALMSRIQVEVWHCLHGQETHNVPEVRKELEVWYTEAKKILEACALAEKPLLDTHGLVLIELRLQTLLFHFYNLDVLLTVASKDLRSQCADSAQKLLGLLPPLGETLSRQEDQFTSCLLWEWLHYPMVAFGRLWVQMLSKGISDSEDSERILEILDNLPRFLETLQSRHTLAGKSKSIAKMIIHHVRVMQHSHHVIQGQVALTSEVHDTVQMGDCVGNLQTNTQTDMLSTPTDATFDTPFDGSIPFADELFLDPTFDWFLWGDQLLS